MAQWEDPYRSPGTPRPTPPPPVPKPTPAPAPRPTPAPTPAPSYPPPGGGGGGGGGGGWSPPAPDPNAYAGLPTQYVMGLRNFVGDPTAFYATRGSEKQAQTDYYNMLNAWSQRAGVPLVPDQWTDVWGLLNAYRTPYAAANPTQQFTMGDAFRFLNRSLMPTPNIPNVTYLRTGNI